jgi:elongation factor G
VIRIEPLDKHEGFEFTDETRGDVIPKEFKKPIEQGIVDSTRSGVLGGYPVVGVRAVLVDGSWHEEDSTDIAFRAAGSIAFRNAMNQADPVLLEPIIDVEIVVPEQYLGEVIADLSCRRGRVVGTTIRADGHVVAAVVPLAEMFGYATKLRSLTQGRALYSTQFSCYAPVPRGESDKLLAGASWG